MRGRWRWAPCAGTSRMLKDAVLPGRWCGAVAGSLPAKWTCRLAHPAWPWHRPLPRRPRPGPRPVQRSGARRGRRRRPSRRHRYRSRLRRSTRHAARLVPLLVRSLALAIPPFKVIDIHTGRPLGLANKHLLALYPQTALELAWNAIKGLLLCRIEVAVE